MLLDEKKAKPKKSVPPQDPIEQDFLEALDRLIKGTPKHKKLRGDKAKEKLKVTASNVALEAGHSRTLIAMENCRYPRVREAIARTKEKKGDFPRTHTELIQKLRADIAALRSEKEKFQAEATLHFLARAKAEKQLAVEQGINARLRKKLAENERIVSILPS